MKFTTNRLQTIAKKRYLEYIKLFPAAAQTRIKEYTTLILTFGAMTLFGIFAINPTITTVIELRKKLDDAKFVNQKLAQKIANLTTLEEKYSNLDDDLTVIENAIPRQPEVPLLFGQIQAIAKKSGVTIASLQSLQVEQATQKKPPPKDASFTFVTEIQGNYQQISSFLNFLSDFERSIILDSVSITRSKDQVNQLVLSIRARAPFRQ